VLSSTIAFVGNRLTNVPDRPVPALGTLVDRLVPLADVFMLVMLSRPRSGSLRNTWVTPATLGLCTAVVVLAVPACALLLASGATAAVAGGLLLIPLAGGAAAVVTVGVAQRRRPN
jgi:hypothetical protein